MAGNGANPKSLVASSYLNSIGRIPLLTPEQEITAGQAIQAWLTHPDPCPPGIKRRGERAKDLLIRSNLRFVVFHIKKHNNLLKVAEFDDLVQAGNLGLIRAAEKFDPTTGYKFVTYAYFWIRQQISHFIANQTRTIRMPTTFSGKAGSIDNTTARLATELGREPTRLEVAQALKMKVEDLDLILYRGQGCSSLDAFTDEDESTTLIDLLNDQTHTQEVEEAEHLSHRIDSLLHCLDQLDPLEQQLIRGAHGLGCKPTSLRHQSIKAGLKVAEGARAYQEAMERLEVMATAAQQQIEPSHTLPHAPQPKHLPKTSKVWRLTRRRHEYPGTPLLELLAA